MPDEIHPAAADLPERFEVTIRSLPATALTVRLRGEWLVYRTWILWAKRVRPSPLAWQIFWQDMAHYGLWKLRPTLACSGGWRTYDGVSWKIAISHQGKHLVSETVGATTCWQISAFRRALERLTEETEPKS